LRRRIQFFTSERTRGELSGGYPILLAARVCMGEVGMHVYIFPMSSFFMMSYAKNYYNY